jgi:hypothetical protein
MGGMAAGVDQMGDEIEEEEQVLLMISPLAGCSLSCM